MAILSFSFFSHEDWVRLENIVKKYADKLQGVIVATSQDIVNAVAEKLSDLSGPLDTLLTEVQALVANTSVDTTALEAAATDVANKVNAIATVAEAPPVVTPPGDGGGGVVGGVSSTGTGDATGLD